ncbi:MAG TPA: PD-(D/E)XK nuclease family protein [Pseudobacteroides sp.]|uniref:PD-(D/E)XK nuclease family protein n=1 Tax=Pseudobacteroides sp. TaxID=1968840 RepID=UPI002F938351
MTYMGSTADKNKNIIPEGFLFTQQSLTTFANCPLKFRKRYIENLKWNSYPDGDVKKRLDMGNDFHLIAHRYFLGIMDEHIEDAELKRWVENLKNSFPINKDYVYLPEYKIRMADNIMRLEANYDLLLVKNGKIEIWDWKTHSLRPDPDKVQRNTSFLKKLQTIVYVFVLKEQSKLISGEDAQSHLISMNYWQPDPPGTIEKIVYSDERHRLFKEEIQSRVVRIMDFDYGEFDKENYIEHCKICEFNWFCNNKKVDFKAMEDDEDFLDSLRWED